MHVRCALAVAVLSAGMLAESVPPACPADRPVDEIIGEVHKLQSKKKSRNKNPFPDVSCIWNWCRQSSRTPPTVPEPAPRTETAGDEGRGSIAENSGKGGESSSKTPDKCDAVMELALEAAHNVEVGDYYFEQQNYRAALMRYKDASEEKPGDIAIVVRMGRSFEKLAEGAQAVEQYQAAQKLTGPQKWSDEAGAALKRLQGPPRP